VSMPPPVPLTRGTRFHARLVERRSPRSTQGHRGSMGPPGHEGPGLLPGAAQLSTKERRRLERLGCRSLRSALASIWRMRSRVTSKSWPTSSSV